MIQFDLSKTFRSTQSNLQLRFEGQIDTGQIVAIHGISGAGKTTLLKMLAGLITPDQGLLEVEGSTWFDSSEGLNFATRKRSLGFVFQDYALFSNMTVMQNIQYGLGPLSDQKFTDRIIQITDIGELLSVKPDNLSGGQRQRVAFARSVVRKPKLLLLDEPLSALDVKLRSVLQNELLELRKLLDVTIIFTSHNIPEVFKLADKVMLIEDGEFRQIGTPSEVLADGDDSVDAIAEVLSYQQQGRLNKMTLLVDGKVISVKVEDSLLKG